MYTYEKCKELLDNKRGSKDSMKIANNTYLKRIDDYFTIMLHSTDIIEIHEKYWVLNTGGWETNTTKDRLNTFSPCSIHQNNYIWYVTGRTGSRIEFFDRMMINENGQLYKEENSIDFVINSKMEDMNIGA